MAGFIDTYLAMKAGIQPVLVVNQVEQGFSNEAQLRHSWLDQVDELQSNLLGEINEFIEGLDSASEEVVQDFELDFLYNEVRNTARNTDHFLQGLRQHCIKSKPKKIDEYFATQMPRLAEEFEYLSERIDVLTDLAIRNSDLLSRFYDHFNSPALKRLENYFQIRNNFELTDFELKMKPENYKKFVSEVNVDIDAPLAELVEIYNENTQTYVELADVVIDTWNEILSNGAASDETLSKFEPALAQLLPPEARSEELIKLLDRAFERLEKRIAVIS